MTTYSNRGNGMKRKTNKTAEVVGRQVMVTNLQCDLLALLEETTRVAEGPSWMPGAPFERCEWVRRNVATCGVGVHTSLRGLVMKGLLESFGGGYRITELGRRKVVVLQEKGFFQ